MDNVLNATMSAQMAGLKADSIDTLLWILPMSLGLGITVGITYFCIKIFRALVNI